MLNILNKNAYVQTVNSGQTVPGWIVPKNAAGNHPESIMFQATGNCQVIIYSSSDPNPIAVAKFFILGNENKICIKCDDSFQNIEITNLTTSAINIAVTALD